MGMEGKYEPSEDEMQKAEEMVTGYQKSIDDLIAKRAVIVGELGLGEVPKGFSVSDSEAGVPGHSYERMYTREVRGVFSGADIVIKRVQWREEKRDTPNGYPTQTIDHNEFTGTIDGAEIENEQAAKIFEKLQPLIINEARIMERLAKSTKVLHEDTSKEISQDALNKKIAAGEKLKNIFGI